MQGLSENLTQTIDPNGNIAQIDPVDGLAVDSSQAKMLLCRQIQSLKKTRDYLEILSQTGARSAAASLPVAVANDQIVATSIPDVTVSGIVPTNGGILSIDLNGHSVVAVYMYTADNGLGFYPQASIDGVNYVTVVGITLTSWYNFPNLAGLTASAFNTAGAGGGGPVLIPCAGYKSVRIVTNRGVVGRTTIILRASVAFPMNYLSLLFNNHANAQFGVAQSISKANTLVPRFYKGLQKVVNNAAATVLSNMLVNNPNDFTIYLLLYNTNTNALLMNAAIYYAIPVAPGFSTIPASNFGLGAFTTGLCIAASQSATVYSPLQLGPDVTIFTST